MLNLSEYEAIITKSVMSYLIPRGIASLWSWLRDKTRAPIRIPIKDFMVGASKKGWDPENLDILSLMAAIRQKALEGAFTFWGKPYKKTNLFGCNQYDPLIPIPQEEWQHLSLDIRWIYYVKDNTETLIPSADGQEKKYLDIYIEAKALKGLKKCKH